MLSMTSETIEIYVEPFLSFTVDVYDICYEPAETSNIWGADSDWALTDDLEYCYDVVSAREALDAQYGWRDIEKGDELSALVKEYSGEIEELVEQEIWEIIDKGDE